MVRPGSVASRCGPGVAGTGRSSRPWSVVIRTIPAGEPIAGLYATGWIKRGPVGLIGHTKGDALETVTRLVADLPVLLAGGTAVGTADAVLALLEERGVEFTTWAGWQALDAHELMLGSLDEVTPGRERVKVVSRAEQVSISRTEALLTL